MADDPELSVSSLYLNDQGHICTNVGGLAVCHDLSDEQLLAFGNAVIDLLLLRLGKLPMTEELLKLISPEGSA